MPAGAGEKERGKPRDAAPGEGVSGPHREWRRGSIQRRREEEDEGGEPCQPRFRENLQKIIVCVLVLRWWKQRQQFG